MASKYRRSRQYVINTRNRLLSQNVQFSFDTKRTNLNNNVIVIGGSGSGKSFRYVKPNVLQLTSSYIFTDPKGELYEDCAPFLKANGYKIHMIDLRNTQGMIKSTHFNPFQYVHEPVDILVLISNLILNTTKKNMAPTDPFWESAEGLGLQALFYYVWDVGVEHPGTHQMMHNMWAVMELLKMADIKYDPETGERIDSELDILMHQLEEQDPNHFAVIQYNKAMKGAEDTVRSIIMTMNARLAPLQFDTLLELLWEDELDIERIGTEKTAVFFVLPDDHKTYNFIVGLIYSQMFHELYLAADTLYGGALPIPVTFMMDEFLNVALPDGFCDLLSTMRSRNISANIIVQDLARTKAMFKESWEAILANCDTMIYLGNNEKETFKYLSEILGDMTIEKRTTGESFSTQDSSSRNYDILGRKLMLESEVRKLDRNKCIISIRGFDPIIDDKVDTLHHPLWVQMCESKKNFYFDARLERVRRRKEQNQKVIQTVYLNHLLATDQKRYKEYEELKLVATESGESLPEKPNCQVIEIDFAQLLQLDKNDLEQASAEPVIFSNRIIEENYEREKAKIERENEIQQEQLEMQEKIQNMSRQEADLYLTLSRQGFDLDQIKIILGIYESKCFTVKELTEKFRPEQSLEELELFAELLKN